MSTVWRVAYGAETRRRLAWSVVAVPLALAAALRAARHPGRLRALAAALLAIPVAVASSALTAALAFLVLINVLAYPFRPWLGLPGSTDDIWASRYADSWGGPTLAGAWATHAGLLLLLGVPVLAWAVRALAGLQRRLTGRRAGTATPATGDVLPVTALAKGPALPGDTSANGPRLPGTAPAADPRLPGTAPVGAARVRGFFAPTPTRGAAGAYRSRGSGGASRPFRTAGAAGWTGRRVGAVLAAVALLVTSSLTAHAAGIGDNLLWTPRGAVSTAALAVTLAPVAALLLVRRTAWWRGGPQPH
ncbi:hypothetical protein GA0070624_1089 [Micromonospora rhizosphaerae]|uniref:Uncharacterized protein n=2 Tax=Micromonospora rhizosphaerae TaxID=568872 RepID=A0A1C6RI64_9ACTN|nr:hypothetical protein GA0070624_1089 [Micromonospora rhizosphaerae]